MAQFVPRSENSPFRL